MYLISIALTICLQNAQAVACSSSALAVEEAGGPFLNDENDVLRCYYSSSLSARKHVE